LKNTLFYVITEKKVPPVSPPLKSLEKIKMLTPQLRTTALSEIKAYQALLWRKVTGEDAMDSDINPASEIWLEGLLTSMRPDPNVHMPDFSSIERFNFYEAQSIAWMELWRSVRVQQAQLWGLSEETAKDVVDEIHRTIY
jgi:hypothetical protein